MPPILFFLMIALAIQSLLWFHMNFRTFIFFYFCGKQHWNFDRDCIESVDYFEQCSYFNNINFLIHKHGIYFHFFVPSSISLIKVLVFSIKIFHLIQFYSKISKIKYFTIFSEIVNEVVFLISFSNRSLLVYRTEKAMAPHSSTLAWKIPWTEEPVRLRSMGLLRVGHD